jgi:hypothetical protein
MTIQAIETEYAGYRFRSRLEARWCVFFKTLGIPFEYEPQGYEVGPAERRRRYLPDFYLPTLRTWVEVKGDPLRLDIDLIADAVDPKTGLGRPNPYYETAVLILGQIPDPGSAYLHWMVSKQGYAPCDKFCACADVQYSQAAFLGVPPVVTAEMKGTELLKPYEHIGVANLGAILCQFGRSVLQPDFGDLTKAQPSALAPISRRVDDAYRAARSARFEHGESG